VVVVVEHPVPSALIEARAAAVTVASAESFFTIADPSARSPSRLPGCRMPGG
jgi:hypothetical protein